MIISINATVCAAADHGDDKERKIAGNDQWRTEPEAQKEGSDCRRSRNSRW
jgi:hypothetical protein